jgi:hypothetical protein
MSISLVVLKQLTGNGTTRTARETCTGSGNPRVSESIADSSTDKHVNITIDASSMTLLWISCDQEITLTPIDASNAPVGSAISVGPTHAYSWTSATGAANPLSGDVAYFHVTNASGAAAALVIEALDDATPP